jgi:3-oxoacyl-[acyl-carrier-protein] synthase II
MANTANKSKAQRRVVITGMGVISPLGNDPGQCFEQVASGASTGRVYPADSSPVRGLHVAAVVPDFDGGAVVGKKNIKRTSRFLQMGLATARSARADANLAAAGYASDRVGCLFGSSLGGLEMVHETASGLAASGLRGVSPFLLPGSLNNMAAGMIAIDAGVNGPCYAVSAGWASSTYALGHAFDMVRSGTADAMLAGGSESLLDAPLATVVLSKSGLFIDALGMQSMNVDKPTEASRPFDETRRGLLAAEGAAMLVLESFESAVARGATLYAEVLGYASMFAPGANHARGSWTGTMVACMQQALRSASVDPREVQYVNAYGSASQLTDAMETHAVKQVFGGHASELWLSSTKGSVGNMLGASGAFETAMTSLALKRGLLPPTANLKTRDPACDLDYMPGAARERRVTIAMKNTFGESGHCGSLILRIAA